MTGTAAILAEGLHKQYDGTPALAGLDLAVPAGTVCGLLGPNGAGKTTAIRILTTLLRYDGGRAEVAGYDVARDAAVVRTKIGLVGQQTAVDEILTGRQNLILFGRLYHLPSAHARRRAGELLDQLGLAEAADRPAKTYSGGMRRRLDIAASLILSPSVLFLDEPTTGLDPRGRIEVWEVVRGLAASGTSVLLTTQYLDEADQLADRIAVLAATAGDGGRVIAVGTPDELKTMLGGDRIEVTLPAGQDISPVVEIVGRVTGSAADVDPAAQRISAVVPDRVSALTELVRALDDSGLVVDDIALRRPTLDDVFLRLTGHRTAEEAGV